MVAEEALALLDRLLPEYGLNNLQETVFCQVWEGKTYAEIANAYSYEHSYIRDVGFRLWQQLSEALSQKISKSNVRAVLSRYARSEQIASPPQRLDLTRQSEDRPPLECPTGPVPLHSPLYVERPPIEIQTYQEVLQPGSLIRIKAPTFRGKTSLLRRLLVHSQVQGLKTVSLSFHRADRAIFSDIDRFLRWLCANLSYQLGVEPRLNDYWNGDLGSKVSCTIYIEEYLLAQFEAPVAIALDELNLLFAFPQLCSEFFPLLRTWYEDSRESAPWQRLRWVLAYATEVYVPLQIHQSPFNVGLAIRLPEFTPAQIVDLAQRHGLDSSTIERLDPFVQMIGCCPGLVRMALFHLAQGTVSIAQLIREAPTLGGIYSNHLRQLLAALSPHPALQAAYQAIVTAPEPISLDPVMAYRLDSLGLIKLNSNRAEPACDLYRQYFAAFLPVDPALFTQAESLS
ncbi:MAG: AAA-like domain-containing protein [Leptolyngbyaceae cyanobacterium]